MDMNFDSHVLKANYRAPYYVRQTPAQKLARESRGVMEGLLADAERELSLNSPINIKVLCHNTDEFVNMLLLAYEGPEDPEIKWKALVRGILDIAKKSQGLPENAYVQIEKITPQED